MEKPDRQSDIIEKKEPKRQKQGTFNFNWAFRIFLISVLISGVLSFASESVTEDVNIWIAILVLFIFIFLNVAFDILGTSVTAATEKQFHSMATKKVKGAKTALMLISNADTVSNFCSDVIGDICGILSGSMCVVIANCFSGIFGWNIFWTNIIVASISSGILIFAKALGKNAAVKHSNNIVHFFSKFISIFKREK